jgi:hypothetical protein
VKTWMFSKTKSEPGTNALSPFRSTLMAQPARVAEGQLCWKVMALYTAQVDSKLWSSYGGSFNPANNVRPGESSPTLASAPFSTITTSILQLDTQIAKSCSDGIKLISPLVGLWSESGSTTYRWTMDWTECNLGNLQAALRFHHFRIVMARRMMPILPFRVNTCCLHVHLK